MLCWSGSGKVSADEVSAALVTCGVRVTEGMMDDMFASIGKDASEDELSFADFADLMQGKANELQTEEGGAMTFALMVHLHPRGNVHRK
jgi:Ca2+-binding EF-hand superfamily protein